MRPCGPNSARRTLFALLALDYHDHHPQLPQSWPGRFRSVQYRTPCKLCAPVRCQTPTKIHKTHQARLYFARYVTKRRNRDWSPDAPLRRKPQSLPQSICGLFVRAPFFGGSDREPQGSPVRASGCPVDQPVRAAALDWSRVRWFLQTTPAWRPPWLTVPMRAL